MPDTLDPIFKALADPTRRKILDTLRDGPRTTSQIVDQFPQLSRFGVMKHMDVLREVCLIRTRTEGRFRVNSLNVAPLRQISERWISKYEAYWANTLLRVKEEAETQTARKKGSEKKQA
ncbi:MAG: metalloregulator ArsR/SmtB family transcription factor [Planctomycetales bacterium]